VHDLGDARRGRRTPVDIVEQYLHKDFKDAVHWLAQKLGFDPRLPAKAKAEAEA
jgi:hypothetical protein